MFYIKCTQNNADQIRSKGFVTLSIDVKCAMAMRNMRVDQMRICETTKKGLILDKISFGSFEAVNGKSESTRFYIRETYEKFKLEQQKKKLADKKKVRELHQ